MEIRICKSSEGRYKVQKRRFLFWRNDNYYDTLHSARERKKFLEQYYECRKEREVWKPLIY